jgi:chitodextrinase
MMKLSNVMGAGLAIAMLMGGTTMAYARDACKDVKFKVTNKRPVRIKITKVEYYNSDNSQVQSEDINPNLECNTGSTCTTNGDDLRDSEGVNLTDFVFFFNDEVSHGNWSNTDRKTQPKEPVDQKCSADRTYSGTPIWTINP